ncbi:MAG: hypothetical protein K6E93_08010 [Bacteroidales bacterium]|nr:hypothetical protein [Bacteroidales bacterium]
MKLDKTNSRFVSTYSDGTCRIEFPVGYENIKKANNAKVYEVPRVWREDGKQYEVGGVIFNGEVIEEIDTKIVKARLGCGLYGLCGWQHVERYD